MSSNPYCLTTTSETQVIDMWRRYIFQRAQSEGVQGQFEAMERMLGAYRDTDLLKSNRFFTEVWLKYVSMHPSFT